MRKSKTYIYIDASNIILSAKDLNLELDLIKFKKYLSDRFRTENIFYFTPNLEHLVEELKILKSLGYKIILKEVFYQSRIKANCDVEISHYITKDIKDNLLDSLVLISGDGDFSMLLDYSIKNNIETKIMSMHRKNTAKIIRKKKEITVEYLFNLSHLIKEKVEKETI